MNKDFILITGHGIFPAASILQVVPVTDVAFELNLTSPTDEDGKFIISIVKNVSVNVDIARSNPTKKNEVETLTDYGYSENTSEQYDFEQSEFLSMLELSDDDDIKGYIKDYNRRQKKVTDYQKAITAIQSNADLPDYETSLAAVKQNAPSSSTERKQERTLTKLKDSLFEKFLTAVESAGDDDDDYTGKKLIDIINSEDSQDNTEHLANSVLKSFYRANFGYLDIDELGEDVDEDDIIDVEDEPSEFLTDEEREEIEALAREEEKERIDRIRKMSEDAVEHADTIRSNPSGENVVSNSLKTVE